MNKFKATLATLLLPFVFFAALFAFLTAAPPPVHAFAGDYALEFDGVSDFVAGQSWRNIIGSDWQITKTVSVWVRPTGAAPVVGQVIEGGMIIGDFPRWFGIFQANVGGQDRIWVVNFDNINPVVPIPILYTVGEWINITVVHANGSMQAYKNGSFVGSVVTGPTASGHPGVNNISLRIGGAVQIGGPPNPPAPPPNCWHTLFTGQIDEVKIWSTALTGDAIRQNVFRTNQVATPGLRAYYQMSNGSGTTLTDNSGNNFQATLEDGRSPNQQGGCSGALPDGDTAAWITSGAFAGPRNALAFDGVDDVVALNANANTILGGSWASAKTAEIWAYPTGNATDLGPIPASAADGDILIGNANWGIARAIIGGEDRLWLFNNDNDGEDRLGLPYAADAWTHLALVHSGDLLSAYRNGALLGSIASGNTAADSNLVIGQGFTGRLDEARLWSTARTAVQIQDNMARTLAHNEGGLAAYYRFDQENDGTVTTVYDTAVNSHHAAMTNMNPATAWVASTAFNTWIGSESSNWADGANWSRYAAPTVADNASLYNYPASNAPAVSGSSFANSVLIGAGATLTVNSGGSLRADGRWFDNGTLHNEGTLQQQQTVDGSDPVQFFATGSYGPLTIDSDGFNMGPVTVTVRALANCINGPEQTVQRCIDITPTNSPDPDTDPGATITFSFLDDELNSNTCAAMEALHWDGMSWIRLDRDTNFGVDGRQCTTEPYQLQVIDVFDFSPFILTNNSEPTAVALQTFSAASTPGGALLLLVSSVFMLLTAVVVYGRRAD